MLCLELMLSQDLVFRDRKTGETVAVLRPYLNRLNETKVAIEAPAHIEIFRRPATRMQREEAAT